MSTDQHQPESSAEPAGPETAGLTLDQAARRRLLRGGLGAAPVILTVASRPVMANTGMCTTASAFGSINASRPDKLSGCGGRKPSYWSNPSYFSVWPTGYLPVTQGYTPATLFDVCFGYIGGYPGKTLLQVLQTTGSGRDAVARHCAAALLNAAKGLTPATVLSVSKVKSVWSSYVRRGYYEPTAGVRWYADWSRPSGTGSILQWIGTTMPA